MVWSICSNYIDAINELRQRATFIWVIYLHTRPSELCSWSILLSRTHFATFPRRCFLWYLFDWIFLCSLLTNGCNNLNMEKEFFTDFFVLESFNEEKNLFYMHFALEKCMILWIDLLKESWNILFLEGVLKYLWNVILTNRLFSTTKTNYFFWK